MLKTKPADNHPQSPPFKPFPVEYFLQQFQDGGADSDNFFFSDDLQQKAETLHAYAVSIQSVLAYMDGFLEALNRASDIDDEALENLGQVHVVLERLSSELAQMTLRLSRYDLLQEEE